MGGANRHGPLYQVSGRGCGRRLGDGWIAEHPMCAFCGCVGDEVDHIMGNEALKTLDDLLDRSAIQTLCRNCHKRKTYATRVRGSESQK